MKKSMIAFSVIGLFTAAVCGGSWYTGQQAEAHYLNLINDANRQFRQMAEEMDVQGEITNVEFKRGFFSSDVSYRLAIKSSQHSFELNGNDTLYHGPLPLNRLATFNFIPVVASIRSQVSLPTGKLVGNGVAAMGYGGKIDGDFSLDAFEFKEDDIHINLSPIDFQYAYHLKNDYLYTDVNINKLELTKAGSNKLEINGISYHFDRDEKHSRYPELYLGKSDGNLKSIRYDDFELKEVAWQSENKIEGEKFISETHFSINDSLSEKMHLGKFNFNFDLQMSAEELNALILHLINEEKHLAQKTAVNLFKKGVMFNISDLSLNKKGSRIGANLNMHLENVDISQIQDLNGLIKAFKSFNLNAEFNRDYVEQIIAEMELDPAEVGVDELFEMAKESDFLRVDDRKIRFDLAVEQGKVVMNGIPLSENEVQGILWMLRMGGLNF